MNKQNRKDSTKQQPSHSVSGRTWSRKLNISAGLFILLVFIFVLGSHAETDSDLAAVTLYQFENPPGYGAVHDDNITPNVYTPAPGKSTNGLPDFIYLNKDKYFPKIRSQQGDSCVVWSTTYYQFTYQAARLNQWDAKNDDSKVFSPKYVWNYLNGGIDQGVHAQSCYDLLSRQGCVRWSEFPQTDDSLEWFGQETDSQTVPSLRNALKTRISYSTNAEFAVAQDSSTTSPVITSYDDPKLTQMKQLIYTGHPLTIYTYVHSFDTKQLSNGELVCIGMAGNEGYHAMTIVGYDDTICYDLNDDGSFQNYEKGAFLVANSWGESYGNEGYIWIMYDALNKVSNAENRCYPNRQPILENNRYFYIEVANYTPQRMAEVTIEQKYRNDITVSLSTSDYTTSSKTSKTTFLNRIGGEKSFDGGNNGYQTRTFVFDYDSLYDANNKIYWVGVTDNNASGTNGSSATTTVKKIRWVNANGTVLKEIGAQSALNGSTGFYYYGIPATSISLNKTSSTLYKGQTETLTATVLPSKATNKSVTWRSSNTSVVTVSSGGKVTYVGTGTATVTATTTDGTNLSASCTYNITDDYQDTYDKAYSVLLHSKTAGKIDFSGDVDYFKFIPSVSGTYLFYTTGSTDTKGFLYNSAQTQLAENDDANISGNNFAFKYTLTAGQTYYIKVCAYSTKTGAYTLNISKDFYGASLASTNQDARRVQMQAEAASILTTMQIKIGANTYTLNRPATGNLDTTVNGARFKVTFVPANGGLSTIWKIEAKIPATITGATNTVSFTFSKGKITDVKSPNLTGLVAYKSSIKTGVDSRATNSLQKLLTSMARTGYTLTVRNWDNTLVNVTSTTKAATGMKIIKTNSSGQIVEIFYVVLFGDATGTGTVNIGDGIIDSSDALVALQDSVQLSQLGALASIAADVNHDGVIDASDALLINQHGVQLITIDQSHLVTTVPDDCYFLDPVVF